MAKTKPCLYCGKPINKGSKYYCSREHVYLYKRETYIKRWKDGLESGTTEKTGINLTVRKYMLEKHNNKCSKCGWGEVNPFTGSVPVEINHIDGDYENNKEKNLEVLCPNCHSLTPNYGSLNRGRGRKNRTW